jgi:hypothetical protein
MVCETLVSTKLNHLTWLITRENFIILTHRESIKSYTNIVMLGTAMPAPQDVGLGLDDEDLCNCSSCN